MLINESLRQSGMATEAVQPPQSLPNFPVRLPEQGLDVEGLGFHNIRNPGEPARKDVGVSPYLMSLGWLAFLSML